MGRNLWHDKNFGDDKKNMWMVNLVGSLEFCCVHRTADTWVCQQPSSRSLESVFTHGNESLASQIFLLRSNILIFRSMESGLAVPFMLNPIRFDVPEGNLRAHVNSFSITSSFRKFSQCFSFFLIKQSQFYISQSNHHHYQSTGEEVEEV